jgi:hypothetical protein
LWKEMGVGYHGDKHYASNRGCNPSTEPRRERTGPDADERHEDHAGEVGLLRYVPCVQAVDLGRRIGCLPRESVR